jgi:hypothetical protein
MKDVEEALKGDDKETIEAKTEALVQASQKLGEKMYADAQATAAAAGAAGDGAEGAPEGAARAQASRPTTTWSTRSSRKSRSDGAAGCRARRRSRRVRVGGPMPVAPRGGCAEGYRDTAWQTRLLRRARRGEERVRRRHQEGLSQAGHEAPP